MEEAKNWCEHCEEQVYYSMCQDTCEKCGDRICTDCSRVAHKYGDEKMEEKPKSRHTLEEELKTINLFISSTKYMIAGYRFISECAHDIQEEDLLTTIFTLLLPEFKTLRPCLQKIQDYTTALEILKETLPSYRKCSSQKERQLFLKTLRALSFQQELNKH